MIKKEWLNQQFIVLFVSCGVCVYVRDVCIVDSMNTSVNQCVSIVHR